MPKEAVPQRGLTTSGKASSLRERAACASASEMKVSGVGTPISWRKFQVAHLSKQRSTTVGEETTGMVPTARNW